MPISRSIADVISSYTFGRKVITVPLHTEDLTPSVIAEWLPNILQLHAMNVADYTHLENVYKGRGHIWQKIRAFDTAKQNTFINENHPYYMVEFKKGFIYGNGVKYSCADDSASTDELSYLSRYMKEIHKDKLNVNLGEDVFKLGHGYQLVFPRDLGDKDIKKHAPFKVYNLKPSSCFVVYSSTYTEEKLFGGIIEGYTDPITQETRYKLLIYTKYEVLTFLLSSPTPSVSGEIAFQEVNPHFIGYVPIVEAYANKDRLGVIDIVETILDAVNTMSSNAVDNIDDFVNSILAIYNMHVTQENIRNIKESGAIELKTTDPNRPADAKYLTNALQQADVMAKYESLIKWAYCIVGVPLPSTEKTSGGDTGDARALGNGWDSSEVVGRQNVVQLRQAEEKILEICLSICHRYPQCPITALEQSDIEINFDIVWKTNLLSKVQALQLLISMNMPKEIALNIVGLTANNHEVAIAWDNLVEREKLEQQAIAMQEIELKKQETEKIEVSNDTENKSTDSKTE